MPNAYRPFILDDRFLGLITSSTFAGLPPAGTLGRVRLVTDRQGLFIDVVSSWLDAEPGKPTSDPLVTRDNVYEIATTLAGHGLLNFIDGAGVKSGHYEYDDPTEEFRFGDALGAPVFGWARDTGRQTMGTVPLARFATLRLSTSVVVGATSTVHTAIQAGQAGQRYYILGANTTAGLDNLWLGPPGVAQDTTQLINVFIEKSRGATNDLVAVDNPSGTSTTVQIDVYEIIV